MNFEDLPDESESERRFPVEARKPGALLSPSPSSSVESTPIISRKNVFSIEALEPDHAPSLLSAAEEDPGEHYTDNFESEYSDTFEPLSASIASAGGPTAPSERAPILQQPACNPRHNTEQPAPPVQALQETSSHSNVAVSLLLDALLQARAKSSLMLTPEALECAARAPIASRVLSSDVLQMLSVYDAPALVMAQALRHELDYARLFVSATRRLADTAVAGRPGFQYTTLASTKEYLRTHGPPRAP
jgi:hypothetical protein